MSLTPSDKTYRNTVVRISDLVVTDWIIRGVTFENSRLVGPAVILPLQNVTLNGCAWEDAEDIFYSIPRGRKQQIGVIGLVDCELYGCHMENIGLAVPEDELPATRKQFAG